MKRTLNLLLGEHMGIHRQDLNAEIDPQDLLPEEQRAKWVVVPKFELYQVFIAAFLIGAGVMASLLGATIGPKYLRYGFPLALILCFLQARIFRKFADRLLRGLGERQTERDA
jgi:hypothetical protein